MLTFTDAEPIVEAKKIPVQYHYYIPIIAMNSMLVRLNYDPDTLYIQNGWWDIPNPPQYADNVPYTQPPTRITGIGFFNDFTNDLPSIVMDVDKQLVYIIDSRHLDELYKKTNHKMAALTITFERAFGDKISWTEIIDEIAKHNKET